MRRTLTVVLVSLLVTACSSSDSVSGVDGDDDGSLTANVDGQTWTASSVEARLVGNIVTISGSDGDLNITLAATTTGTGTYDLAAGSANGQVTEGGETWFAVGLGGGGTITITSLSSGGARGTFSFDAGPVANSATGTRSITNGSFDVKF